MKKNKTIGYQAPQYFDINGDADEVPEIKSLLEEFSIIAKQRRQPEWYTKNAALYFTYEGKYFKIVPGDIKTSNEVFDNLCSELIDRLYDIGAYDMFDSCMID